MAYSNLSKKYLRPAMIILSETEPVAGTDANAGKWDLGTTYLYLTDDGRDAVSVQPQRIENKQRMINGRMRSYFVADKKSFSTSWENLPSRKTLVDAYDITEPIGTRYATSDAFGAGQDIKDWYENHTGDFWMMLVYDADSTAGGASHTNQVELYNVFFESFSYDIVKRGQYNDLWSVSISLVEV